MKIAIITDQHFGARSDALWMHDYQKKFYDTVFFPYMKQNQIQVVLNGGDVFDDRKNIDILTLNKAKRIFFDPLQKYGILMWIIPGNHDVFFKSMNDISSINELLRSYNNITIIESPETLQFGGVGITMLPWLNNSNYHGSIRYIDKDTSKYMLGHLEIAGFEMHAGIKNEHGMDRNIFKDYDHVWSGHFHQPSEQDNIRYLGSPMEFTWADYGCPRGFHVFDTQTQQLEFIRNPHTLFEKIFYDENVIDVKNFDYKQYSKKFVQVHVTNKTDIKKYDKFVDSLYEIDTIDLVVYDNNQINLQTQINSIQSNQSTIDLMSDYVDNIQDPNLDKSDIKKILSNLYTEALNAVV